MSSIEREQLLGYLLGALDDHEQRHIATRLQREPELLRSLESVQRTLRPLEALPRSYEPPAGLATRTCRMMLAERGRTERLPQLSSVSPMAHWSQGFRFADLAVGVAIFLAAAALIVPALQNSRFNAHVFTCQNKLRQIGVALTQYSERHGGYFPVVPTQGRLASAGIYAPILMEHGLLTESHQVVCPGSPLAEDRHYRVPQLAEVQRVGADQVGELCRRMGGSYGYSLGYVQEGVYYGTRNLRRHHFALMSDRPSLHLPDFQTVNHSARGQNVLFEDGHVRFLATPNAPGPSSHLFMNDAGRIAPGLHVDDSVIVSSAAYPLLSPEK